MGMGRRQWRRRSHDERRRERRPSLRDARRRAGRARADGVAPVVRRSGAVRAGHAARRRSRQTRARPGGRVGGACARRVPESPANRAVACSASCGSSSDVRSARNGRSRAALASRQGSTRTTARARTAPASPARWCFSSRSSRDTAMSARPDSTAPPGSTSSSGTGTSRHRRRARGARPRELGDPLFVVVTVDRGPLGPVVPALEDGHLLEPGSQRAQERGRIEVVGHAPDRRPERPDGPNL